VTILQEQVKDKVAKHQMILIGSICPNGSVS
jgi:hypothetical protein